MAGDARIELATVVLETIIIPFNQSPMTGIIAHLFNQNNIQNKNKLTYIIYKYIYSVNK